MYEFSNDFYNSLPSGIFQVLFQQFAERQGLFMVIHPKCLTFFMVERFTSYIIRIISLHIVKRGLLVCESRLHGTERYKNPSASSCMEIQFFGQDDTQAVQPEQRFLSAIIILVPDMLFLVKRYFLLGKYTDLCSF